MDKNVSRVKNSIFGFIPTEWNVVKIAEVTDFQEGPGILAEDFRDNGVPLIRIAGMKSKYVTLDGCNYLDPNMVELKWKHFKLNVGDVVISASASLDKVSEVDELTKGAIVYTGLIRFRMKQDLSKQYFKSFVKSNFFIKQVNDNQTGAIIHHFGPSHLKKMYILLPPIDEQTKISNRLYEVDEYYSNLSNLIEKKKSIRIAAAQELLTGKTRLKNYNKKWETKNNIFTFKKGVQISAKFLDDKLEYPMYNGGISYSGYTDNYNSENSIIISEGGNSCGFVNYVKNKFWAGGHCYVILTTKLDTNFLYYLLKFKEKDIMSLRVGSGLPNVQGKALREMKFFYPSTIDEQVAIAEVLSNMDAEISNLEKKLDKVALIKQGLMQQLLTGKIRLV